MVLEFKEIVELLVTSITKALQGKGSAAHVWQHFQDAERYPPTQTAVLQNLEKHAVFFKKKSLKKNKETFNQQMKDRSKHIPIPLSNKKAVA